ncbi:hypothetical protein C5167_049310 [Papaver somniferum]|uniref:N6-adenosine-methyltransferase MT-A70-like n=1 Tax=Papaver somniferum TaxID=3469 RepID=A0A4Y7KNB9_PAPSO|nr:N6-adenosine-methyltransferase MT-A70-like [Papaver somniferum]RZC73830.1 hypothetical protein C5167_049310 [Papaver somniferum]
MGVQSDGQDDISYIKDLRQQLETRIENQRSTQRDLISSIQTLIPDIVSSIDLSLKVVTTFNVRDYTSAPIPKPNPNPNLKTSPSNLPSHQLSRNPSIESKTTILQNPSSSKPTPPVVHPSIDDDETDKFSAVVDSSGSPLSIVRAMVAVCLLERVPFTPIDSSAVLRKLENDSSATSAEKSALLELGGETGAILAVEMALRSMADENGGVDLEEFVISGKSRVMVLGIDRTRLVKELPESSQLQQPEELNSTNESQNQNQPVITSGAEVYGMGGSIPRPQDMWFGGDPSLSGMPPIFPGGPRSMMGTRGGPRGMGLMGMPRMMSPFHRPQMIQNPTTGSPNLTSLKPRTEEEDMKDLEALLNKKSFRELQKSKTGEELLDLIHRPTAKETAVAAKFKSKGGSQVKMYCTALTKEDCRRQAGSYIACEKVHFRRIIAPHTDINLGDCSFLDTCRHMKTCKYVHYELDSSQDVPDMMMGSAQPTKSIRPLRPEYCSDAELGASQWINCDIRNFRMDILGQFGVIMADPPWDIHMELPYGTMADDEMRNLNVPALQTDGLIFLWVTGRAMELGRECLELWGYKRVEEIIWVKTNQLQRIIRTGRTGHWLNHSKEHCLVGIKGDPLVNRNIDTDVIVAEVRETSRKPDEMYPLLERISPRTRKLELFARMHNTHSGWMSLGNQLQGVHLVDEGLRARFKAAYPEVEVQPSSPPRTSAMDIDAEATPLEPYTSEEKLMSNTDVEMVG